MTSTTENLKAEMVVIGGGGAGLAAALAAAEGGCPSVVVLEKAVTGVLLLDILCPLKKHHRRNGIGICGDYSEDVAVRKSTRTALCSSTSSSVRAEFSTTGSNSLRKISINAFTIIGSNWEPEHLSSSSMTSCLLSPRR